MTAQEALKAALRDIVVPVLRADGYKGSAPSWTRANELGDVAVVNVQSSSWSTSQELRCTINLALAPDPWLDWNAAKMGKERSKSVKEYDGLYRDRLDPTATDPRGSEGWWMVSDARTAARAAEDMVVQLESDGLPRLARLLERDAMVDTVRQGDLGFMKATSMATYFDMALAVLLADEGASDEVTEVVAAMVSSENPKRSRLGQELNPWVSERLAAKSSPTR